MLKKLQNASLAILIMILVASCAPNPAAKASEVTPASGEGPIDAVAEDISEAGNADEGLDASELDDVDSILKEIEKI